VLPAGQWPGEPGVSTGRSCASSCEIGSVDKAGPIYDNGPRMVSAREIAEHQKLSPKYLESLLAALRSAGLVRSVRGTAGGYTLTRPPAEINLRQIYHVFEGTDGFVECTADPEYCTGQTTA
jgi:Rrf2 family protein